MSKEVGVGGDFRTEWAQRVGERLLRGEGFDPEEDRPALVTPDGVLTDHYWTLRGAGQSFTNRPFSSPPPVAEAVSDPDVEITVTPAQYEELITLRATKANEAELAMLRERRRALEIDVEQAYDLLDAEKKAHGETGLLRSTAEAQRDAWMDQYTLQNALRAEAENQIAEHGAARDKANRIAILCASTTAGAVTTALFGQRIADFLWALL
jgi:hypothetical protein